MIEGDERVSSYFKGKIDEQQGEEGGSKRKLLKALKHLSQERPDLGMIGYFSQMARQTETLTHRHNKKLTATDSSEEEDESP